jgi:aminoglycoside phosphotransferase (APT) family kinase protein
VPTEGEGPPPDPAGPGVQPVHGDYHERNVLLDDSDTISAVVDWDMVTRMPRGFEIVRCLTYAGMLDRPRREAYLTAYRQHTRLAPEECPAAVDLWWRANLRESWLYRTRLIENDRSVQQFFPEHLELLTRFADPSFRAELAGDLRRLAGADR